MRGTAAETLLERAKSLGCGRAEIFEAGATWTPVTYEDGRLKSAQTSESSAVAVRVWKRGRIGFAASTRPDDTAVVDSAARVAEFGEETDLEFVSESPVRNDLALFDPGVAAYPLERMLEVGDGLVDQLSRAARGFLPFVELGKRVAWKRLTTSRGQRVEAEGTILALGAGGVLVEPGNVLTVSRSEAGRRASLDPAGLARAILWLFSHARRIVPPARGAHPVLFSPHAAFDLMAPVLACLDGKSVAKGESPWKNREGEQVLAPEFTLVDDPHRPWAVRTAPFDDEGTPTTRRVLVDRGVLRCFNLDLESARALGRRSTGSGYRPDAYTAPGPGPSNLILGRGSRSKTELVAAMSRGLYVENLIGAWAGNPFSGEVSGNVELGFKVENGEIIGRVKDCMVSVNVFEAFRARLAGLSSETETNEAAQTLPYVLIDGVNVSSRE